MTGHRRGFPLWVGHLEGSPVRAGAWTATPLSGRLELRLPFLEAGWTVPLAVRAEHPDGRRRVGRVVDVTRVAQGLLLAAGMLLAYGLGRRRSRGRRRWAGSPARPSGPPRPILRRGKTP